MTLCRHGIMFDEETCNSRCNKACRCTLPALVSAVHYSCPLQLYITTTCACCPHGPDSAHVHRVSHCACGICTLHTRAQLTSELNCNAENWTWWLQRPCVVIVLWLTRRRQFEVQQGLYITPFVRAVLVALIQHMCREHTVPAVFVACRFGCAPSNQPRWLARCDISLLLTLCPVLHSQGRGERDFSKRVTKTALPFLRYKSRRAARPCETCGADDLYRNTSSRV